MIERLDNTQTKTQQIIQKIQNDPPTNTMIKFFEYLKSCNVANLDEH